MPLTCPHCNHELTPHEIVSLHARYARSKRVDYSRQPRKLTQQDVTRIRQALARGAKQVDLAQKYGVSQALISKIKHGSRRS